VVVNANIKNNNNETHLVDWIQISMSEEGEIPGGNVIKLFSE
jgi:hypothetical protein